MNQAWLSVVVGVVDLILGICGFLWAQVYFGPNTGLAQLLGIDPISWTLLWVFAIQLIGGIRFFKFINFLFSGSVILVNIITTYVLFLSRIIHDPQAIDYISSEVFLQLAGSAISIILAVYSTMLLVNKQNKIGLVNCFNQKIG